MGMDASIYKVSKEMSDRYSKCDDELNELTLDLTNAVTELMVKYPTLNSNPSRELLEETVTKDELHKVDSLFKDEYEKEVERDGNFGKEIHYWRKAYGLDNYIMQKWSKGVRQHYIRIFFTKDDVIELIAYMENNTDFEKGYSFVNTDNFFGKFSMWDKYEFDRTLSMFKNLVDNWEDDMLYFYFAQD